MRWTFLPLQRWENERLNSVSARAVQKKRFHRRYKQRNIYIYLHEMCHGSWPTWPRQLTVVCVHGHILTSSEPLPARSGPLSSSPFPKPQIFNCQMRVSLGSRRPQIPPLPAAIQYCDRTHPGCHLIHKVKTGAASRIKTYKQSTYLTRTLNTRGRMRDECSLLLCLWDTDLKGRLQRYDRARERHWRNVSSVPWR